MFFWKNRNSTKPIKIVLASYPHTGSTLLVNLVHGALAPDDEMSYRANNLNKDKLITKTHNVDIDLIIKKNKDYNIYFIVPERENHKKIDSKYHKYRNVLILNYDDFVETDQYKLPDISEFIIKELRDFLPNSVFTIDDDNVMRDQITERIENMNKRYEEIKDKDFSYVDKFYGIHGSHRGRSG